MSLPAERTPLPERRRLLRRASLPPVAFALAGLAIVLAAVGPPYAPLDKADRVGYAICHQIPERSFTLDGRQLPLCARCTGTFLGALLGLAAMALRHRGRASRLPPARVLAVLLGFMGLWALDGLNSYLTLFPGAPHLYEPRNWLRLVTGLLNGLALIAFTLPIFNYGVWRSPQPEHAVKNVGELISLLPVAALTALVVRAEAGPLLYPVALLSSLGVLVLLVLLNSLIAAVVTRREAYAASWREALVPVGLGLVLALAEIAALGVVRDYLTATFGMPF